MSEGFLKTGLDRHRRRSFSVAEGEILFGQVRSSGMNTLVKDQNPRKDRNVDWQDLRKPACGKGDLSDRTQAEIRYSPRFVQFLWLYAHFPLSIKRPPVHLR